MLLRIVLDIHLIRLSSCDLASDSSVEFLFHPQMAIERPKSCSATLILVRMVKGLDVCMSRNVPRVKQNLKKKKKKKHHGDILNWKKHLIKKQCKKLDSVIVRLVIIALCKNEV